MRRKYPPDKRLLKERERWYQQNISPRHTTILGINRVPTLPPSEITHPSRRIDQGERSERSPNIVAGPRVAPFRVCIFYLLFTKKKFEMEASRVCLFVMKYACQKSPNSCLPLNSCEYAIKKFRKIFYYFFFQKL